MSCCGARVATCGWDRFRDPRVGRDVLCGIVLGLVCAVATHVVNGVPTWMPFVHQTPIPFFENPAWDVRQSPLATPFDIVRDTLQQALGGLALLFIFRLVLRRTWAAAVAVGIVFSLAVSAGRTWGSRRPRRS